MRDRDPYIYRRKLAIGYRSNLVLYIIKPTWDWKEAFPLLFATEDAEIADQTAKTSCKNEINRQLTAKKK